MGQDRLTWAAVTGVVAALRDAGSAVVLTTHDEDVVALADRTTAVTRPDQPPAPPAPRRPLVARCGPLALLADGHPGDPCRSCCLRTGRRACWCSPYSSSSPPIGLWAPARGADAGAPAPTGRARARGGAPAARTRGGPLGGVVDLAARRSRRRRRPSPPGCACSSSCCRPRCWSATSTPTLSATTSASSCGCPPGPSWPLAAALQRVHTFGDLWTEIARARRVRGIGASARSPRSVLDELWALTVGILVRSLLAAATLAVAMDARGFATAYRRTWAAPAPVASRGHAPRRRRAAPGRGRAARLTSPLCRWHVGSKVWT